MYGLPPDYLAALAGQIASLSAFLGGFSATYLAMLLTMSERSRPVSWASAAAVVSAAAFIVATVAATMLVAGLHPATPAWVAAGLPINFARAVMTVCFGIGVYGSLSTLGCSGWIRSRRMGRLSSGVAVAAAAIITLMLA